MVEIKTITEVSKLVGLSVRQIQECEKEELNLMKKPKIKKRYEHGSLYSDEDMEKLWLISIYKRAGYNNPQIASEINNPNYDKTDSLKKLIKKLQQKKAEIDTLINKANAIINIDVVTPSSVRNSSVFGNDVTFDNALTIVEMVNICVNSKFAPEISDEVLENISTILNDALNKIMEYKKNGFNCSCEEVKKQISFIHKAFYDCFACLKLFVFFAELYVVFAPGSNFAKKLDLEFGLGSGNFFFEAFKCYFENNADNEFDRGILEVFQNIVSFGKENYKPDSVEIQNEVEKFVNVLKRIGVDDRELKMVLGRVAFSLNEANRLNVYNKNSIYQGHEKTISKAFLLYCEKLVKCKQ